MAQMFDTIAALDLLDTAVHRERMRAIHAGSLKMVGDAAVAAPGWSGLAGWYVVAVQGGREKQAKEALTEAQFAAYLPIEHYERTVGRGRAARKVKRERAYFPGYLFVNCAMCSTLWRALRDVPGVVDIPACEAGGIPRPVSALIVSMLQAREQAGELDPPKPPAFRKGEPLHITQGPFAAMIGAFQSAPRKDRIKILIGGLLLDMPASALERCTEVA